MSFRAWLSMLSTLFSRPPDSGLGAAPNLQIQRMIFKTYCRKWVSGLGCQRYLRCFRDPQIQGWVQPRIYKINVWFLTHIVENEFWGLVIYAIYVVFQSLRFRARCSPESTNQRMIFKTYCRKWVSGLGCQRYLRMIFNTYCRKWVSGLDCQRYQRMIFHTYSRKWVSGLGCQCYLLFF